MSHLHDYEICRETPQGIVEFCTKCRHKIVVKKGYGQRINNEAYRKQHLRDFLQPTGSTAKLFKKEYGKPVYEHRKETSE